MTDKEYILNELDERTLLEQLAEESAELSQAALKYIRAHELSKNYTPKTEEEAERDLQEEFSDVLTVAELLELIDCRNDKKLQRWAEWLGYKDVEHDEEENEVIKAVKAIKGYCISNRSCMGCCLFDDEKCGCGISDRPCAWKEIKK